MTIFQEAEVPFDLASWAGPDLSPGYAILACTREDVVRRGGIWVLWFDDVESVRAVAREVPGWSSLRTDLAVPASVNVALEHARTIGAKGVLAVFGGEDWDLNDIRCERSEDEEDDVG